MQSLAGLVSANYRSDKFGKLTTHRPIAAIPFGSRYRLIDFTLSNMVNSGITSVGIVTPHRYRSLMDHIGSGKEFGLSRKAGGLFILPGSSYGYDLGLGKISIKDVKGNIQFFNRINFDRVVLSTCNKIYNIDYNDVEKQHIENEANVTFIYKKVKSADAGEYVLELNENGQIRAIRKLRKKESDVNLFLDSFIIDKNVMLKLVDWYRDNSYMDLMDALSESFMRLAINAYEFKGYVKSINGVQDYIEASKELLKESTMKDLLMNKRLIHTKIHDAAPVKYFDSAKVSNSLVGTGSIIKGEVKNSVIFRDTVIEKGAKIKDSVIMQKCYIGENVVIENAIIEKNVAFDAGVVCKGTENKVLIMTDE